LSYDEVLDLADNGGFWMRRRARCFAQPARRSAALAAGAERSCVVELFPGLDVADVPFHH
jgi:hypothetical protein